MKTDLESKEINDLVNLFILKEQNTINEIKKEKGKISKVINEILKKFKNKTRVIYIGAGTSGRLGVLDAVECRPTFNTDIFMGLIAGGKNAIYKAKEGSEDNEKLSIQDLKKIKLSKNDVLVGIAASGETPYTLSGIKYGNKIGALTVGISSNPKSSLAKFSKLNISPDIKYEIISGSSRLSSGTAQKIILNMISSISMIKSGKVYKNLMIDVLPTNKKLVKRAISIISSICNIPFNKAELLFKKSNGNTRIAIIMYYKKCSLTKAKQLLSRTTSLNQIIG